MWVPAQDTRRFRRPSSEKRRLINVVLSWRQAHDTNTFGKHLEWRVALRLLGLEVWLCTVSVCQDLQVSHEISDVDRNSTQQYPPPRSRSTSRQKTSWGRSIPFSTQQYTISCCLCSSHSPTPSTGVCFGLQ